MNSRKRYRIHAEKIERTIVDRLSALLKDHNILEDAITHTFGGENTVLQQIDHEISQKTNESKQCQRLLDVFSQQVRKKSWKILTFSYTLPFHNKFVLHQKYIVEGLSIRQIADEFLSSKEAVRLGLMNAGIALREKSKPHGRPSRRNMGSVC